MTEILSQLLHIDDTLKQIAVTHAGWLFLILFAIIFCETGLVVTPMLPGDSLLFAVGALAAQGSVSFPWIALVLLVAAIGGDSFNYLLGNRLGRGLFQRGWRVLTPENLRRCEDFYSLHGPNAVIMARFLPFFRSLIPFVGGASRMHYPLYLRFSILGSFAWVLLFAGAGFLFGQIPIVQRHFEVTMILVAMLIVTVSMTLTYHKSRAMRSSTG